MRDNISIIDKETIEINGREYVSEDTSLVFVIKCLIKEYDDLKGEYCKLVEQYEQVAGIVSKENDAYVMTFSDLSRRLGMDRQALMTISGRAEFDKYRTYVTKPRKAPALIVTRQSLTLLQDFLNSKPKTKKSEKGFNRLLKDISDGYTC